MKASDVRAALLAALLAVAAGAAGASGCQLAQAEMRVRIVEQRPIAMLSLNGTELPMLLDTGAFFSMLSPAAATQLELPLRRLPHDIRISGYTGPIDAKLTTVEKVGLLGTEFRNVEFLVGGNALGAGIMGVLGRNFLAMADAEYDLAHGVVRLTFPKGECRETNFAHWAGEAPVIVAPLGGHREDTAIRVDVAINGRKTTALLDTGAAHSALTLKAARRAGIKESELTPAGRAGGAGQGLVKSWIGNVATFELGGQKISNNRLRIDDADAEQGMLLGLDYFLSHRIYVSRLQRQLYATWNGGAVFTLNRETAGERDTRFAALPQEVANDDADALARRGEAALAAKNYARALQDLNRACELAPGRADCFYARARTHLAMDRFDLALADIDEALRLDATLNEARLRRVALRSHAGDRSGAQADLAQLDASLPPSSSLRARMGHLHVALDQTAAALRQFELWIATHGKDQQRASVLNARCWLRARLNLDLPLALQDCKDAIDQDGGAAAYRDSLGWTHLRLGDWARAKSAFDAALAIEPLAFSLYGRAFALRRLGDAAGAEADLAAARKLDPAIADKVRKEGFEFAAPELR